MRLLIISDNHGDLDALMSTLNREQDVDHILHLGDITLNETDYAPYTITGVKGNNLGDPEDWPNEKMMVIDGLNVWMTHGHLYAVKQGIDALHHKAKSLGAQVVLYGHTHQLSSFTYEGIHYLNPGSLHFSRSYAIYDNGFIEFYDLKGRKLHGTDH